MKKIVVAIDGHSSCGKSTMAKALARTVGYIYVDTGAMYRVVTLYALRNRLIENGRIYEFALQQHIDCSRVKVSFQLDPETNLPLACLNGEVVEDEIRGMEVSNNVSPIAALPFVRKFLVAQSQFRQLLHRLFESGNPVILAVVFVSDTFEFNLDQFIHQLQPPLVFFVLRPRFRFSFGFRFGFAFVLV